MKTDMMLNICYLFITLAFMASIADCANKLPSGMSQHQYCHGCMATMKELIKKLPKNLKGSRDIAVIEALEKICTPSNFVEYHYSPPKTVKACTLLLENNEDEIEEALKKKNIDNVVTTICNDVTSACEGIDVTKDDKDAKFADIDLTNDKGESSKSIKVDPSSGKVVYEEEKTANNEGKTLSKKKKQKKKKGESGKPAKKVKETASGGKQKGAIHNLNVDINDPSSIEKIMSQINKLTQQYNGDSNEKEEL